MTARYTPPRRDQQRIEDARSILGTTFRARSRPRSSNDAPFRGIRSPESGQTVENQFEVLPENWSSPNESSDSRSSHSRILTSRSWLRPLQEAGNYSTDLSLI